MALGINVNSSWTYNVSFSYRFPKAIEFNGDVTASLRSADGEILGSATIPLSGAQTTWERINITLIPTKSGSTNDNTFTLTVDGTEAAGSTIHFALLSLFPPTFKNRPNGMRIDISEALLEMKPSFFRFPGGNNLEGDTVSTRWQWNATVGPLANRPGRQGDWGYVNTDGLGLLEYMQWIEDMEMEAIMAIWAGFTLGGETVPEGQLDPFVQQAIDQINFVIGDPAESEPAALRASLGRSEPFKLQHVEIGNEDNFSANSYIARWETFVTALKEKFPQLKFLATTITFNPILDPDPEEYDVHVYQTPRWFAENSFFYDDFERNNTLYFEGEYAAISTNKSDIFGTIENGRLAFPTIQSATGEAAFMIGLERNSDIVFAASYAPLLQNVNSTQWTPDLVSFDAGAVYKSTSFYVQKLFSLNRGDEYIPSTLPERNGTLFWSVVRNTSPSEVIIKVSNTAEDEASLSFSLPFENVSESGTLQLLTAQSANASNFPANTDPIVPVTSDLVTGKMFEYTAPGLSMSVITVAIN
jgi:alpha-N-arabinofuranosidase